MHIFSYLFAVRSRMTLLRDLDHEGCARWSLATRPTLVGFLWFFQAVLLAKQPSKPSAITRVACPQNSLSIGASFVLCRSGWAWSGCERRQTTSSPRTSSPRGRGRARGSQSRTWKRVHRRSLAAGSWDTTRRHLLGRRIKSPGPPAGSAFHPPSLLREAQPSWIGSPAASTPTHTARALDVLARHSKRMVWCASGCDPRRLRS